MEKFKTNYRFEGVKIWNPRQFSVLQWAAQRANGAVRESRTISPVLVFVRPHLLKNPVKLSET